MKRVLLTGASGFIGCHCLRPLLERGYEVHAVSRSAPRERLEGVTWHQADLLAEDAARALVRQVAPTHLLHLAWYVVPGKLIAAPINFDWVLVSMTMFREFAAAGGRRAVFGGSSYEYDWNYGYCSERLTPTIPNTVYGACKHALQELVCSFATTQALSTAWPRIFFAYGPNEHRERLVPSVILSLLKGEPARCSHGRQIRDYMHVQDVADGLVQVLDSDVQGPVNIAAGQGLALREIVLAIGRIMGRPELIQLGAIPARSNDTPLVVGDNSRLVSEVGWRQQVELEAGLRQTVGWWRQNLG